MMIMDLRGTVLVQVGQGFGFTDGWNVWRGVTSWANHPFGPGGFFHLARGWSAAPLVGSTWVLLGQGELVVWASQLEPILLVC